MLKRSRRNITRSMYAIKSRFSIPPQKMAETYTYLAVSDEFRHMTGKCFDDPTNIVSTSKYSRDNENIHQMMAVTRKYLQQQYEFDINQ
jgi:hypothetical protein